MCEECDINVGHEVAHAVEADGFLVEVSEVVGAARAIGRWTKTSMAKNASAALHVHKTG